MGLSMQAAAAAGIPFYVLDRPNPIGASVSGWVLEPRNASFMGEYPIPVQYGLTAGELALMIKGEKLLPGLENLNLTVIPVQGYRREILWSETNLPWISPSPNIVDLDTAILYPGTGFFEAFNLVSEGRGTLLPFKKIGAPWVDAQNLTDNLNKYGLPGVNFAPTQFTPLNITEMSGTPKFLNEMVYGVEIHVTNQKSIRPVELGVYLACTFYQMAPNKTGMIDENSLALHAGTTQFFNLLNSSANPPEIIQGWQDGVDQYLKRRAPYLLY